MLDIIVDVALEKKTSRSISMALVDIAVVMKTTSLSRSFDTAFNNAQPRPLR